MYPPPAGYAPSSYGPYGGYYNGGAQYDARASPYDRPPQGAPPQAPAPQDHYAAAAAGAAPYSYDQRPPAGHEHPHDRGSYQPPPATPSQDPYAAYGGYEAYCRQYYANASGGAAAAGHPPSSYPPPSSPPSYGPPPEVGGYPPPAASGYPPPGAAPSRADERPPDPHAAHYAAYGAPGYPPPAAAPGYPPPEYGTPPPGAYPPPAGYPPPPEAYAGAHYGPYGPPPHPGYGAPPYGAPPQHPGYGMQPPGYGPPPYGPPAPAGYGPPAMPGGRPASPRRDRRGPAQGGKGMKRRDESGKGCRDRDQRVGNSGDPKMRLQQWLQLHQSWLAMWLEGVDPPRRAVTTPNVTAMLFANLQPKKGGAPGEKEFGFVIATSRAAAKRKERERECAKEMVTILDTLPVDDMKAWCQLPVLGGPPPGAKLEGEGNFLDKLTAFVRRRCPKVTLEMPEPSAFVMVGSLAFPSSEKHHGVDADLPVLDKFDAGFGDLMREARRVSGLVKKQWFISVLWAKPEQKEDLKSFALGVGLATDRDLARVRAMHSAEVRAQILVEAMFRKAVPQKALPDAGAN